MTLKTFLFLVFLCKFSNCDTNSTSTNSFIPSHYDIQLRVILEDNEPPGAKFSAPGTTLISGATQAPTSQLKLLGYELKIDKETVKVSSKNQEGISEPLNVTEVYTDYFGNLTIHLEKEVEAGQQLEIYLEHVANIKPWSGGLVQSIYSTESGEERRLAVTRYYDELEERPFFAVWRAFPCFDEREIWPDKRGPIIPRSTFDLTIIRKDNYTSLANTELVSSTPDPKYKGWIMDKYASTIEMTPSMVSLLVSDFSHISSTTSHNKTVGIHAPSHLLKNGGGEYALNISSKLLDFYEEYFNTSFYSSKMDFPVIPKFYRSVESWGLSFLPQQMNKVELLVEPSATVEAKFQVDGTIAQALARQWVGPWWNDMYLNLGIVRYLKYLGMENVDSGMPAIETSYLEGVQSGFNRDNYSNDNQTLATTLWKVEAIANRGAALLRMAEGCLPPGTIQKALQTYIRKVKVETQTPENKKPNAEDFFKMLQTAAAGDNHVDLDVSKFMLSWSTQSGYPLVRVQIANETNVKLSQEKFKISSTSEDEEDLSGQNATWQIPVSVFTEEQSQLENVTLPHLWLEQDADATPKYLEHNVSNWIMMNYNASGYYRVLYEDSLLTLIQQQLEKNASKISPLSRAQLLDDYFIFAEKNYSDIRTALNLTRYLEQETNFVVWRIVLNYFEDFERRFSSHSGYPIFQKYLQKRLDAVLTSIGITDAPQDPTLKKALRTEIIAKACTQGGPSPLCITEAKKFLKDLKDSNCNGSISSPLKESLSCAAVAIGGKEGFDLFFKRYEDLLGETGKANATEKERHDALLPLTCAVEKHLVEELYRKTVDENSTVVQMNDGKFILEALIQKPEGRRQLLPFLEENLDKILDIYDTFKRLNRPSRGKRFSFIRNEGLVLVENLLSNVSIFYSTQTQLDEIAAFIKENKGKLHDSYENIENALETRKHNVEWMNSKGAVILEWLQSVE
ncbi:unnamed protein product [Orchesella dallaii]|uniref:Aminopeptidase n=1 Tax=Orchesella dallaii TaxID=48710 RepID=A0ABP1R0V2_9HEXA